MKNKDTYQRIGTPPFLFTNYAISTVDSSNLLFFQLSAISNLTDFGYLVLIRSSYHFIPIVSNESNSRNKW